MSCGCSSGDGPARRDSANELYALKPWLRPPTPIGGADVAGARSLCARNTQTSDADRAEAIYAVLPWLRPPPIHRELGADSEIGPDGPHDPWPAADERVHQRTTHPPVLNRLLLDALRGLNGQACDHKRREARRRVEQALTDWSAGRAF